MNRSILMLSALLLAQDASADPSSKDRVYAADQNSNTVSVVDPSTNRLLGYIKLGDPRPYVLSALYKGQVNVHGLGFSPNHRTIVVVSTITNSVTFVDTATNHVKGTAYIGRNPHEAFFTPDGNEVWATVRGEDYISVIDASTYLETARIPTTSGPGMVMFSVDGERAVVCNSFNPVVEVFDVKTRRLLKSIPVVSPFSPFIQVTPDGREAWLTHKDVGKVTRVDLKSLTVAGVIDTGPITNHLAFAKTAEGLRAYVTVGGENLVKVYSADQASDLVTTIAVGALPHGIWGSDDGSRIFLALENGDGVDVVETATNTKIAHIPSGQAPQALIYVSNAVPEGNGLQNLTPRKDAPENSTALLKSQDGRGGRGLIVSRNLGLIDTVDVSVYNLRPATDYEVLFDGKLPPVAAFTTDAKGNAMASALGPTRKITPASNQDTKTVVSVVVPGDTSRPVLLGE
ncbi:YncE family protein [Pararhizobium sp. DWP1-1-3]|uniref:YncE family protein n=1 Tax=Pararhizobium sp. DWP1-1-3 TaxID=2804652 RepID=UPI003CEBEC84